LGGTIGTNPIDSIVSSRLGAFCEIVTNTNEAIAMVAKVKATAYKIFFLL
jgi:hypothetical protein